ncbi:Shedu immune nuclease family protein [Pseudoalteromonas spongiae]|uniref:Shedu immune nuclease family protein n=1 Tax=Pseudoalteromonas spongiae TaxID=298657 RepID=UPI000C2CE808|nr:Shedu immune nuclease family protein [Pseudoalteromonas spongiae]
MNDFTPPPLTDEDVILNSKLEHLYNHEFGDGRFFQVIFSDENETHIKLAARTCLKVVYLKEKDDIEGFEIIKIVSKKEKERVKLSKFNLEQLTCFLEFIKELDLKDVTKRRISLADDELSVLDSDTKAKIATLLSGDDGSDVVYELLDKGLITNQDLVNTGYRKHQLELFESLLYKDGLANYKAQIGHPNTKDETAWQHFFQSNEWIFGYGLDYRFQGILQKEFHSSTSNAAGKEEVIADFLLGDKKFTTFVELKLPTTELFNKSKNRSNCWSLSNSLIDAFSQILEQKASGQIKIETTKELIGDNYEEITQRSYDSKTILIMGSWAQIDDDPIGIKRIKEKTLELFRRDSRNVELVTYDELYERARFIVHNEKHSKRS